MSISLAKLNAHKIENSLHAYTKCMLLTDKQRIAYFQAYTKPTQNRLKTIKTMSHMTPSGHTFP